jgi:hypothetical protein
MATAYTLISSVTVGSGGAANITFSNIPGTYTDLLLFHSMRTTTGTYNSEDMAIDINNSDANFSWLLLRGQDTSTKSGSANTNNLWSRLNEPGATSNTFSHGQFYIANYTASINKTISPDTIIETNNANGSIVDLNSVLWTNTATITSIKLYHRFSNTIAQYSTAYLYGISNA